VRCRPIAVGTENGAPIEIHFRRLEADAPLITAGLRRIFDEARASASSPCVLPDP
jgi:hypothetical protein